MLDPELPMPPHQPGPQDAAAGPRAHVKVDMSAAAGDARAAIAARRAVGLQDATVCIQPQHEDTPADAVKGEQGGKQSISSQAKAQRKAEGEGVKARPYSAILFWLTWPTLLIWLIDIAGVDLGPFDNWLMWLLLITVIGCHIADGFMSGTRQFIHNINREVDVQQYMQQLREAESCIVFHACCYHMETRTRSVSSYNSATKTYETHIETYTVTVVTHTAREEWPATAYYDATEALTGLDDVPLCKLYLEKYRAFTSDEVLAGFEADFHRFCAANTRDVFNDHTQELVVPGFRERTLCFQNTSEPPDWVHPICYWSAVAALCGWVYKRVLDHHTGVKRHKVVKIFDRADTRTD